MAKWDYLFESDVELRKLERLAKEGGGLPDWVRYRAALIRQGRDFTVPLFKLIERGHRGGCRDQLFRRMFGEKAKDCKYKIPKNLTLEKTIDGFNFRVTPSENSGGVGSRLKWQCPMCGAWVGAAVRVINGHLSRKDHNA